MVVTSHVQGANFIVRKSPWESAALGNCKHTAKSANCSHNLQVSAVSEQQHSPATVLSLSSTDQIGTNRSVQIH